MDSKRNKYLQFIIRIIYDEDRELEEKINMRLMKGTLLYLRQVEDVLKSKAKIETEAT